jgi:hypothetical protein
MGSLKPAQWHLGIEFTVQSQNLQCFCHALVVGEEPPRRGVRSGSLRALANATVTSFSCADVMVSCCRALDANVFQNQECFNFRADGLYRLPMIFHSSSKFLRTD